MLELSSANLKKGLRNTDKVVNVVPVCVKMPIQGIVKHIAYLILMIVYINTLISALLF